MKEDSSEKSSQWEVATLAGGCFWCVESDLEKLVGVKKVISGYAGGSVKNPSYKQVSSGSTGHIEAVQVYFDPKELSYSQLLDVFWRKINPLDQGGQFVDRGFQYSSAIFYHNETQKKLAEESKQELQEKGPFKWLLIDSPSKGRIPRILDSKKALKDNVVTEIRKLDNFYPAEEYHQDYYKKNPLKYWYYRRGSKRDRDLERIWKDFKDFKTLPEKKSSQKDQSSNESKPSKLLSEKASQPKPSSEKKSFSPFQVAWAEASSPEESTIQTKESSHSAKPKIYSKPSKKEIKKKLTLLQYRVTQKDKTETPFDNKYWDNKEEGIYVDIVTGEPLFSSLDKYDSKTGWPSFTRPLVEDNIVEKEDRKLFLKRTEVRSRYADSHLGHVFEDGPAPTGLRYCINSASLQFIPKNQLEEKGYGEFLNLFQSKE